MIQGPDLMMISTLFSPVLDPSFSQNTPQPCILIQLSSGLRFNGKTRSERHYIIGSTLGRLGDYIENVPEELFFSFLSKVFK